MCKKYGGILNNYTIEDVCKLASYMIDQEASMELLYLGVMSRTRG